MADAAQAVKFDVVFGCELEQGALRFAAQGGGFDKSSVKSLHRFGGRLEQLTHQRIALGVGLRGAALLHLRQAVVQGLNQQHTAFGVVQQVVLQIGVALHHPDIAQHLVQHAGRTACAALVAQAVKPVPSGRTQQADDDLAVRKRGVVVGNFANSRVFVRRVSGFGHQLIELNGGVHRVL